MILLNDFKKQYNELKTHIHEAITAVGESGWLILGAEVQHFEDKIQTMLQSHYAIGCANGLDALELGLRALNIKPGEKVLTTPLSAFATTLAIIRAGGKPVFVDVDESGLIDLEHCEKVFEKHSDIRLFIPVHLFGHALSLIDLENLKKKFNLRIIEDCAQAIAAKSNSRFVGSVGDLAAYSLYPTKNLGCYGDGGFVTTNNPNYAEKVKSLRDYGQTAKYEHTELGMNSRLDELQAAILNRALLPKLAEYTARRKYIANQYLNNILNPAIQLPKIPCDSESVWHLFPIHCHQRDALQSFLKAAGIQTGVHYPALITEQRALKEYAAYEILTPLSKAMEFTQNELSLPLHPLLTDSEIEKIIQQCNQWTA